MNYREAIGTLAPPELGSPPGQSGAAAPPMPPSSVAAAPVGPNPGMPAQQIPAEIAHHAKTHAFARAAAQDFLTGKITRDQLAEALGANEYDYPKYRAENIVHPLAPPTPGQQ